MAEPDRLSKAIRSGALVSYSGFLAGKLISFATMIVLARLLAPQDFGLVAIGFLVLAVNEALTEAGAGAAVVWRRGNLDLTAAVALSISLISGTAMAVVVFVFAESLADFFSAPDAAGVIRAFAICILLSSPSAVFSGILQRKMDFKRRIIPEIAKAVIKGGVGIPMALAGFGVWSLVYSHMASILIGLCLAIWLSGWRPRLSIDWAETRAILPYALQIAAIGLLGVAIKKLDVVIVGYRFETEMLGYYTLAFSLIELVVLGICWSASQALFPGLSQNVDDLARLRQVFAKGLTVLLAVTFPIATGMAVMAEPFILSVFGEKWAPAIPLIQILAFYALIYSVGFNLGDIYKATGRPHILTWISVFNLVLAGPILLIGSYWGVAGIAAGQVAIACVISVVNWVVAGRVIGIGPSLLVSSMRRPLIATILAVMASLSVDWAVGLDLSQTMRLFAMGTCGAVVYAGVLTICLRTLPLRSKSALENPKPLGEHGKAPE
ncbi:lipopolysaccharide biosynthesis protein [Pseudotabrizicola sp.]|uniref:lipopolysaccharide biosynthesis protein n=1 Tax=Pseudotabrizicola sp. TaxID=2939647 RepID=UPI00272050B7|nr:lipopolysaccharide biosynthesis protein [Pseudotabrizicola sp.]MDO8883845.1 lipopolysaccharide biosynthesis protein [Pseudotabrizicola sp.]